MSVCDICNKQIDWSDGYVLTTKQVATSEAYWKHTLKGPWSYMRSMDPDGDTLAMLVEQQAGQSSGWLTCEECSRLFTFDRVAAKRYARERRSSPPGAGPVSTDSVARAAATVWKTLCGKWPSSIQITGSQAPSSASPAVKSSATTNKCDFCGRMLGANEQIAMLDESGLQKMEAIGGLRRSRPASVRDPAGKLRWIACSRCMDAATRAAKTVLETRTIRKWWQFWK